MKKIILLIGVLAGLLCIPLNAHAYVLLNFEMPRENTPGDYSHTVSTSYGDIDFNGRIYNKIDSDIIADHSVPAAAAGTGYFLKNTDANKVLTMTFDFNVNTIDAWIVIEAGTGNSVLAQAYNGATLLDSVTLYPNTIPNWKSWKNDIDMGGYSSPINKLVLTGSKSNIFGIDDMKITPVPEPMSLSLLGMGLLGAIGAGFRRKK